MNFEISIDSTTGWGYVAITGVIDMDGLRQLLIQAWQHPVYANIRCAMWNLLDADTQLSLDELFDFTQWILDNKHGQGAKVIALVASDDLMFGMSRMFHAIQNNFGWVVEVFRNEEEAQVWLQAQDPVE